MGFGDTEVMDGASQDAKRLSLQSELGGVGNQSLSNMGPLLLYRHPPERQNGMCVWFKKRVVLEMYVCIKWL